MPTSRCERSVTRSLGTRCEIKNLNSFRFMEQAIEFEARRQIEMLEDGGKIVQETRLYDPDKNETRSMRTKEDAQDYRYFPDPDLLPLVITEEMIDDVTQDDAEVCRKHRRDESCVRLWLSPAQANQLTSSTAYIHVRS